MRIVALPRSPKALLLDFDSTLYTNPAYASFQTDVLVERLARERGEDLASTKAVLDTLKAKMRAEGAAATSLGNLFLELGISIETSVAWREALIDPFDWLYPDPALGIALDRLGAAFALALVTNNPVSVGRRGLAALGIDSRIGCVVGLDSTGRSKPDPAPYALAASMLGVEAGDCVSVGDRHDVDIAPALALGMGAILVDGVEDVIRLPELLIPATA